TSQTLADRLTHVLGPGRLSTGNRTEHFPCRSVEAMLLFVRTGVWAALVQPFKRSQIENRRQRQFSPSRLALQAGFQLARHTPTINLGLHALSCSASGCFPLKNTPRRFLQVSSRLRGEKSSDSRG